LRFGLLVVLALLAGAFGAHFLLEDRGYVLVNFLDYTIETSVPVLLFALGVFYLALRALGWLWRAPRRLGQAAGELRHRRAEKHFTRGLIEYTEGQWHRGERLLTRGARRTGSPLLHYLTAARAAQLQGAHRRRDDWLRLACETTPEAQTAVQLTQAELQLAHHQHEEALATLRRDEQRDAGHPMALRLLARLHEQTGDWRALARLVPRLRKRRAMDRDELDALQLRAVTRLFESDGLTHEMLDGAWQDLPRRLRQRPRMRIARARALRALELHTRCEDEVRQALNAGHWDEALVGIYASLETGDDPRHLKRIEQWLKSRPEDAMLLQAAGRLAIRCQLWGKARSYLESSLDIRPRADTYQLYGRLLSHLGHDDEAGRAFRSGLRLLADSSDGLPALESPRDASFRQAESETGESPEHAEAPDDGKVRDRGADSGESGSPDAGGESPEASRAAGARER